MASTYTQDVEFNSGFDALQTPVHMFTAAVICGATPPPLTEAFRYLDLACGNGLTLALMADAYPHGEFVGIDINPDHIARATTRANAAHLSNLRFVEGDIADLDPEDFGVFDYCAVSGVYSWLDRDRRARTREIIAQMTKAGGLIYLDYSSQPGMAQTAPLYRLLRELAKSSGGSSAERLTSATKQADRMRQDGARFFAANPLASARLQAIMENPPEDEAHEVLNLQENGFWSADVIQDMAECGSIFLANAGLHHNLPSLSSSPEASERQKDWPVDLQQMHFDVQWNVHQRRDIYIRNCVQSSDFDLAAALGETPYYSMPDALSIEHRRSLAKSLPNFDFCSNEASAFAEAATKGGTFGALFDRLSLLGMAAEASTALARHFLAARILSVAPGSPASFASGGDVEMASALNRMILIEDIGSEHARPFASPVAGSRVLLPLKDRLYLWGVLGLDLGKAWERLSGLQHVFRDTQNNQLTRATFIQTIESSLPGFRQHIMPELLRLKILQPLKDQQ